MISPGEPPLALVNGVILTEGDTLHGAVVERIEPDRVLLRWEGQEISIRVGR